MVWDESFCVTWDGSFCVAWVEVFLMVGDEFFPHGFFFFFSKAD